MDIKQEDLIKFWTWVFGEDGVEFAHAIFGDLVVYRRLGWNMRDNEWNIEAIPSNPDLNLLYKFAIPKLQDKGYDIDLGAHRKGGFIANIIHFKLLTNIMLDKKYESEYSDSPTEALYNAIMKVIDNEVK